MVADSSTCSAIASALGRISVSIASACAMVGRTFVFTSSASASIFELVFFKTTNMATRTPACNKTAIPVKATNTGVRFSISLLQQFHSSSIQRKAGLQCLQILRCSRLPRRVLLGLTARLLGSAGLFFMLAHDARAFLSAGSRPRGLCRPILRSGLAPPAHEFSHTRDLPRPERAKLLGSRCPAVERKELRPELLTLVAPKTKQSCFHHDPTLVFLLVNHSIDGTSFERQIQLQGSL